MPSLQPLQPLGGPVNPTPGMTPDIYEAARRRQVMADALVADAKSPTGGGGTLFGALGQGFKGYAGASMQQQNAVDLTRFAPASPQAATSLQPQPAFTLPNPVAAFGSVFNTLGGMFGGSPSTPQPGLIEPNPNNPAAASVSSTPDIGAGRRWGDDD